MDEQNNLYTGRTTDTFLIIRDILSRPVCGRLCLQGRMSYRQRSFLIRTFVPTFLQFHWEELQFLHPLLQFVLSRRGHRIHFLITPVVVLVGVGVENLNNNETQREICGKTLKCQLML